MYRPNKVLRYGDKGRMVKKVQHQLTLLGYEVGTIDGIYGFLTEEAVEGLQRDFHLQPDGIVGPLTWQVLNANLSDQVKRLLVGWQHSDDIQPIQTLFRHGESLSAFISSGFRLTGAREAAGKLAIRPDLLTWLRKHNLPLWVGIKLPESHREIEGLLFSRKGTKRALSELESEIRDFRPSGLVLTVPEKILPRHCILFNRLIKLTKRTFPKLSLAVNLPFPEPNLEKAIDYAYLANLSEYLIFNPLSDLDEVTRRLKRVLRKVPCWKIVLGVAGSGYDQQLVKKIDCVKEFNLRGACVFGLGREGEIFWSRIDHEIFTREINPARSS